MSWQGEAWRAFRGSGPLAGVTARNVADVCGDAKARQVRSHGDGAIFPICGLGVAFAQYNSGLRKGLCNLCHLVMAVMLTNPYPMGSELPASEVGKGLVDLGLGVHHEGASHGNRLGDGLTGQDQVMRILMRVQADTVTVNVEQRGFGAG